MESTTIKPIGKGQYTFPKEWRQKLGIDKKEATAEFTGSEIIIRPKEDLTWDVSKISFDVLSEEDKELIAKADADYKTAKKDAFATLDEVFGE